MCPCAGGVDPDEYRLVVERAVRGLTAEPDLLLQPLTERITSLATEERFEEAADVRDRASALARAINRQRKFDQLRRAGNIHIDLGPLGGVALDHGRLQSAWGEGELPSLGLPTATDQFFRSDEPLAPLGRELADELGCIASWLDKNAPDLTLDHCDGELTSALPALPSFAPRKGLAVDDSDFVTSSRRSRR
jgi:DNA polymerase-3 subunit epsilon